MNRIQDAIVWGGEQMSDIAILKEMIKDTSTASLVKHKNNNYKAILEQKEDKDPNNPKANYTVEIIGQE